jgi:hypothetical protein
LKTDVVVTLLPTTNQSTDESTELKEKVPSQGPKPEIKNQTSQSKTDKAQSQKPQIENQTNKSQSEGPKPEREGTPPLTGIPANWREVLFFPERCLREKVPSRLAKLMIQPQSGQNQIMILLLMKAMSSQIMILLLQAKKVYQIIKNLSFQLLPCLLYICIRQRR